MTDKHWISYWVSNWNRALKVFAVFYIHWFSKLDATYFSVVKTNICNLLNSTPKTITKRIHSYFSLKIFSNLLSKSLFLSSIPPIGYMQVCTSILVWNFGHILFCSSIVVIHLWGRPKNIDPYIAKTTTGCPVLGLLLMGNSNFSASLGIGNWGIQVISKTSIIVMLYGPDAFLSWTYLRYLIARIWLLAGLLSLLVDGCFTAPWLKVNYYPRMYYSHFFCLLLWFVTLNLHV